MEHWLKASLHDHHEQSRELDILKRILV